MQGSRRQFLQYSALVAACGLAKHKALAAALKVVGLKDTYAGDFFIGTALPTNAVLHNDREFLQRVLKDFNAVTMENAMKWIRSQPDGFHWRWDIADAFVDFAQQNQLYAVGHVLVWHSQIPQSVFLDDQGKRVDKASLFDRMENRIRTMVGRYRGKIQAWDVVNEAIADSSGAWRDSPWHQIAGPEFIERAFHCARDTDPSAQLLYNDFNLFIPAKRDFAAAMVRDFKKRQVPIDAVGIQGHISLNTPKHLSDIEDAIVAFTREGVRVHITELDIDVLPFDKKYMGANISELSEYKKELDPYTEGLPDKVQQQLTDRYTQLFEILLKHRDKIDRVTFWGISDAKTWKNYFPILGRTNYPLLYDRQWQPKPCYKALMNLKK